MMGNEYTWKEISENEFAVFYLDSMFCKGFSSDVTATLTAYALNTVTTLHGILSEVPEPKILELDRRIEDENDSPT